MILSSGEIGANVVSLALLIFAIPYIIASLTISIRRLHDSDRSGWWLLVGLIPLAGSLILLVLFLMPSKE